MEANENSIPQTGRVEDEYVRIGTTLFRILNQPMMNGSFRKIRVEWKMSTFLVRTRWRKYPNMMDSVPCPVIQTIATT